MNKNEKVKKYKLPTNSPYNEKGAFRWPGNYNSAFYFLSNIPKFNSLEDYYKHNNFTDEVMDDLQDWTLTDVTKSALFYYLDIKIQERQKIGADLIVIHDWRIITFLLLQLNLTEELLKFVDYLDLLDFSSEKMKISGAFQTVEALSILNKPLSNPMGLRKLLNFLKVDLPSIDFLVNQAIKENNYNQIVFFLYTFEAGISDKYILTETLKHYKTLKKGQIISKKEIKDFTNIVWDDIKADL